MFDLVQRPRLKGRSSLHGKRSAWLSVEALEDRCVPSITLVSRSINATAGTAFTGTVATFTDSNPSAVAANYSGVISWGDTAVSPGDGNAVHIVADPVTAGQFDVQGTHTYSQPGSFSIQATVSDNQGNTATATAFYSQTNLVTDNQANLAADGFAPAAHVDPNLINPWGISFTPTGEFWVANHNTGTSTLYDGSGATVGPAVTIPVADGGTGNATGNPVSPAPVTGTVANTTADFNVAGPGTAAQFIFASEDATISAWNGGASAVTKVDNADFTNGPVYKGLAIGSNASGNFLYAANFRSGTVDMFDKNFQKVTLGQGGFGTFTDPTGDLAGFAPFGIQSISGKIYVTYAKQDAARHTDVAGAGNGFIDVFDTSGNFVKRLTSHGELNSPWGLTLAPSTFGTFANDLLVGNFRDGRILAFDPGSGAFAGALKGPNTQPIVLGGIWGLAFGNNGGAGSASTLYFLAGINHSTHGLFGSQTFVPATGGTATVVPQSFVYDAATKTLTITGSSFAYTQATTADAAGTHTTYTFTMDGKTSSFPDTQLSRVVVNGQGANATAMLVTSDTYTGTDGQTHETVEAITMGNGTGMVQKTDSHGNGINFLELSGFHTVFAAAGHSDPGLINGTPGMVNIFVSAGSYSYMNSGGAFYYITGAKYVYSFAAAPADIAYHYDGSGPSTMVALGTKYSYMFGTDGGQSFFNEAVGFTFNEGLARHSGQDLAYFYDSPGNDVFMGFTFFSQMSSMTAAGAFAEYVSASDFAHVYAFSLVGGNDTASIFDANQNTVFGFRRVM